MKKFYFLNLILLLIFNVSCGSDEKAKGEVEESGVISKSWNYVASGFKSEESLKTKDSLKQALIANHEKNLLHRFPEYESVARWFASKPKQLKGLDGTFYKIQSGVLQEGKTITRRDLVDLSENHSYLYFYETEKEFFIVELRTLAEKVECLNVRSISRGLMKQPMYDYVFDQNGNLKQEIFQGDVSSSLYDKDGKLYFEYSSEVNGTDLKNTVDLGKILEIEV